MTLTKREQPFTIRSLFALLSLVLISLAASNLFQNVEGKALGQASSIGFHGHLSASEIKPRIGISQKTLQTGSSEDSVHGAEIFECEESTAWRLVTSDELFSSLMLAQTLPIEVGMSGRGIDTSVSVVDTSRRSFNGSSASQELYFESLYTYFNNLHIKTKQQPQVFGKNAINIIEIYGNGVSVTNEEVWELVDRSTSKFNLKNIDMIVLYLLSTERARTRRVKSVADYINSQLKAGGEGWRTERINTRTSKHILIFRKQSNRLKVLESRDCSHKGFIGTTVEFDRGEHGDDIFVAFIGLDLTKIKPPSALHRVLEKITKACATTRQVRLIGGYLLSKKINKQNQKLYKTKYTDPTSQEYMREWIDVHRLDIYDFMSLNGDFNMGISYEDIDELVSRAVPSDTQKGVKEGVDERKRQAFEKMVEKFVDISKGGYCPKLPKMIPDGVALDKALTRGDYRPKAADVYRTFHPVLQEFSRNIGDSKNLGFFYWIFDAFGAGVSGAAPLYKVLTDFGDGWYSSSCYSAGIVLTRGENIPVTNPYRSLTFINAELEWRMRNNRSSKGSLSLSTIKQYIVNGGGLSPQPSIVTVKTMGYVEPKFLKQAP